MMRGSLRSTPKDSSNRSAMMNADRRCASCGLHAARGAGRTRHRRARHDGNLLAAQSVADHLEPAARQDAGDLDRSGPDHRAPGQPPVSRGRENKPTTWKWRVSSGSTRSTRRRRRSTPFAESKSALRARKRRNASWPKSPGFSISLRPPTRRSRRRAGRCRTKTCRRALTRQ